MHKKSTSKPSQANFFLPELCQAEALLGLVLLAELLVLVLVLAEPINQGFDWSRLALTSLFVQWVVLLTAAILCFLRPWLAHLKIVTASLITCIVVLLLTFLCSWATQYFNAEYLGIYLRAESLGVFYLRNSLISLIMSAIVLRFFYLQSESKRQQQAQLQARLEALQARIQPHFLFNTLNSIASLVAIDAEKAELAILDLSDLLRASLANHNGLSTWQQEVNLGQQYLSIENHRFGERMQLDWQIENVPPQLPIPHLTLQPLLENAVLHGIQPSVAGGTISVQASYQNNILQLKVSNPIPAQGSKHKGMQLALDNIQARLVSHFGHTAKLITSSKDAVFIAHISYPCKLTPTEADQDHGNLNR